MTPNYNYPRTGSHAPSATCPDDIEAREAIADARLDVVGAFTVWRKSRPSSSWGRDLSDFVRLFKAGRAEVTAETVALITSLSTSCLRKWHAKKKKGGWRALIPSSRANNRKCLIDRDDEVQETIVGLLLSRPQSSPTFIHSFVEARFYGEPKRVPSVQAVQRWLRAWKKVSENERRLSQIEDPDKHKSRRMPAPGDMSAEIERLNQIFEADSTSLDVLCTDGPMALINVVELYTRRARVLVTPRDRAESVIALFRRCLIDWGVPEVWRADNGASYKNHWVRRVLADMGITADYCDPYTPNQKPFVERFIKTISHGLFQNLPGYKGHSIEEQQKLRARHKFASRLGMPEGKLFGVSLSSAELQQRCDDWIAYIYEHKAHESLGGRSPFEVTASWRCPVKRIPDNRTLDLLLARPAGKDGWRNVRTKGIKVDRGWYWLEEPADDSPKAKAAFERCMELTGMAEKVEVREDPTDLGVIYVFDAAGEFLCRAVNPERLGMNRAEAAARMKARARAIDAGSATRRES